MDLESSDIHSEKMCEAKITLDVTAKEHISCAS